jgi:CheY-like chemotaxis protein
MRRLLVIDDDDHIRELARLALERVGGHSVVTAESGAAGLELARSERPDAVVVDVMMPGMDGPETVRRLRADPAIADIPVILLTAKVQPSDTARFGDLGVQAVLAKPFDPMRLAADVAAALGWGR